MKKNDVYICGDVNIDIFVPEVSQLPQKGQELVIDEMFSHVGGGAAITSMGLAKLGLKVDFEGVLGEDFYGNYILSELKKAGVGLEHLRFSDKNRTGISLSFTDDSDRCFVTSRGTNSEVDLGSISFDNAREAEFVHVTGYGGKKRHDMYLELLTRLKEMGVKVSFDLGWDDTGEWYEGMIELFPYIDVLFMNETEILHYSRKKTVEDAMEAFGRDEMILAVKRGSRGSCAVYRGKAYFCESLAVDVVDTTGAGDSFNAGFLYGIIRKEGIEKALLYGNICGGLSTTAYGGNTAFPAAEELMAIAERRQGSI